MRLSTAKSTDLLIVAMAWWCCAVVSAFSPSSTRRIAARSGLSHLGPSGRHCSVFGSSRGYRDLPAKRRRTSLASIPVDNAQPECADAVVCGGGPAGLLSAIMLAQKYPEKLIRLFDRLGPPPDPSDETVWSDVAKFYLIGLGGRGQTALKRFGVWEAVEARCVAVRGRKDWPPDSEEGVERIFTDEEKVTTQVLPRDKLVGVLHRHIVAHYADRIELNYGYEVQPLDFGFGDDDNPQVLLQVSRCTTDQVGGKTVTEEPIDDILCDTDTAFKVAADLVVAADGTVRTVANAMECRDAQDRASLSPFSRLLLGRPFKVQRFVDDNERIYKTIPLRVPSDWRGDLNYSARTKDGRVTFDALPANEGGGYCGVLLLRKTDPLAKDGAEPEALGELLDDVLPQFSEHLDEATIATVAKKPVSCLPSFRYTGPRLNQGNRCLLLGDCAHTVKPYFGLGANSALQDVQILSDVLDECQHDWTTAVRTYSQRQAPEAKALVRLSRDLDRPGTLGFLTFVLPIILDAIFHKAMPRVFTPNVITMLQREDYTFNQVARRKRLDRLGQATILGGTLFGFVWATRTVIGLVARRLGKSTSFVSISLALATAMYALLRKFAAKYLVAGLAPADVLSRLASSIKRSTNKSFRVYWTSFTVI